MTLLLFNFTHPYLFIYYEKHEHKIHKISDEQCVAKMAMECYILSRLMNDIQEKLFHENKIL